MSKPELSVLAALALELSPGAEPGRLALAVDDAGELAGLVARDLARLVPDAATLDLAMVAGLFDPAELLRPGYPVHAELGRLAARAPGAAGGRIIYCDMTDNYRVRPEPAEFIKALDAAGL